MSGVFPQTIRTFVAESANYTANVGDFVNVTTGTSAITVTLPKSPGLGAIVTVKKVDSGTGAVTVVSADGSTVDGVVGTTGRAQAATQYLAWTLWNDGINWWQA